MERQYLPGKRLTELRERLGVTQKQFAVACGVHTDTIGHYERSQSPIPIDLLFFLDEIGCDSLYILGKADSPFKTMGKWEEAKAKIKEMIA